jgi:hypothetical protein
MLPLCDNRASHSRPRFKERAMSQKAICPRGHIWDPSTLAGLPPTETPRCPICGEEESPRIRNPLAHLGRWCRNNPLLAGLSGLCFLLSLVLIVSIFLARSKIQAAREEEEKALFVASQIESQLLSAMRRKDREERQEQRREIEIREAKLVNMEKEFLAQLHAAEKAASDARKQRDEQFQHRRLAEELAQTAEQVRQQASSRRAEIARQLVKMYVAAGTRLMENGDLSASLLWFTEALRLAEKERLPAQTHRLRLAYVLAQCPRPVQMRLYEKKDAERRPAQLRRQASTDRRRRRRSRGVGCGRRQAYRRSVDARSGGHTCRV